MIHNKKQWKITYDYLLLKIYHINNLKLNERINSTIMEKNKRN